MNFTEHLEKIPFFLSLFLPVIIFFLFGLFLAWMGFRGDHKRFKKAVEENDHLAADLTRALAPEKDMSQTLLGRIERQKAEWSAAIKSAQDELLTEQCRTRDLSNQLAATHSKSNSSAATPDIDLQKAIAQKDADIANLQAEIERLSSSASASPAPIQSSLDLAAEDPPQKIDAKYGLIFDTRPSQIDDLKKIKGLGKAIEDKLHALGIYRFSQITAWTPAQTHAIEKHLGLNNRIKRDKWAIQAGRLS